MAEDLTIEILSGIRAATEKTAEETARISKDLAEFKGSTREEFHAVRADMAGLRSELIAHVAASEMRTATQMTEVIGAVQELTRTFKETSQVLPRVAKCEADIEALKRRLPDS